MAKYTTPEALRDLYTAFGGSPAAVAALETDADIIKALAVYIAGGGAAELPAVTSPTDDGKVLTVVSGKWQAAALPADDNDNNAET